MPAKPPQRRWYSCWRQSSRAALFLLMTNFKLVVKHRQVYILVMTTTPFFPLWRARLAPMGQRVQRLRRQSLMHLDLLFGSLLPAWLLAQSDDGTNSRESIYSVRRTFFGFLYQV